MGTRGRNIHRTEFGANIINDAGKFRVANGEATRWREDEVEGPREKDSRARDVGNIRGHVPRRHGVRRVKRGEWGP